MKVLKFGGASLNSAGAVKNVVSILQLFTGQKITVVVSAMGKTTNALELYTESCFTDDIQQATVLLKKIKEYHIAVMLELFPEGNSIFEEVNKIFKETERKMLYPHKADYGFYYDEIVSSGELISSKIISTYLNYQGIKNRWLDVRDCIRTDNTYREAKVDWIITERQIKQNLFSLLSGTEDIIVTQGFIGATSGNNTTTLGREGSDYSAAILAYCAGAEEVVIWKDVPGVLNADPKWFDATVKLRQLSYNDAIELAYYGATVIHPKTLKPLQNKNIPLLVKSFVVPLEDGTVISHETQTEPLIPSFIFKINQVLLTISSKDFSFIMEDALSDIFGMFAEHKVKMNLMQNSALSFSVCVDYDKYKIPSLLHELQQHFKVRYNEHLELVTIRHYDQVTMDRVTEKKIILVEQKSRTTAQIVMKNAD